ncbi:MAG TPA: zinc ribbon domain-containing protein [Syntrophales bacterium]|nr:zinc ribbon domain-containing protein [Syntrophales bacterium]HOX93308.1 zinc ribbon domain-containing protein [Syntrophales bacterium]HPI56509.1 zinc ribbon domain-containing protein [Syntrophales bacterium]HPN25070.1 zinc ribbon domain-containing protein [Syntrophales bacterium]HQM29187.1 zinc ribbon domain-containing protein [Syntrophales bacterium]
MPIYEYQCRKCLKAFEVVQKVSDPELTSCKFCKGAVKRMMSVTSFHLKGSGWYVTDYGGRKAPVAEKEKGEPPAAESKPAETAKPDDTGTT